MNNLPIFALGALVGTCLYAYHVETGEGMGKVLIRPDSNGNLHFSLDGLYSLMKLPFYNINMWKPSNLDMNYVFFVTVSGSIAVAGKYLLSMI